MSGSVVYYLLAPGRSPDEGARVKIGVTTRLVDRVATLARETKRRDLILMAAEPGYQDREEQRHREFGRFRLTGEWFWLSPSLDWHIAGLRRQSPDPFAVVGLPDKGVRPTPRRAIVIRLSRQGLAKVDRLAEEHRTSRANVLRQLLRAGLEAHDNGEFTIVKEEI